MQEYTECVPGGYTHIKSIILHTEHRAHEYHLYNFKLNSKTTTQKHPIAMITINQYHWLFSVSIRRISHPYYLNVKQHTYIYNMFTYATKNTPNNNGPNSYQQYFHES